MTSQPTSRDAPLAAASIHLALANKLDGEMLACWLGRELGCQRIQTHAAAEPWTRTVAGLTPHLVIVDPRRENDGLQAALRWQQRSGVAMLVLDAKPCEGVLLQILPQPGVSYLTRSAGRDVLAGGLRTIWQQRQRVFDPAFAARLRHSARGFRLEHLPTGSLSMLTPRELEVMRHLAAGESVIQCAARLKLSTSTVDNHRSRLMKKLQIRKAGVLTRRAIREGLIQP